MVAYMYIFDFSLQNGLHMFAFRLDGFLENGLYIFTYMLNYSLQNDFAYICKDIGSFFIKWFAIWLFFTRCFVYIYF